MIYYDRIRSHTPSKVNHKIDAHTLEIIHQLEFKGPEAIERRFRELDREWDIDRVMMLNFSALVLMQLLAARKNKKWLWGPLIQTPFLLLHATYGWCPPMLWFRPMGFRTRQEIQEEREILLKLSSDRQLQELSEYH
jgi:hypothetical protein